jgi:hypothetical protein
LHDRLSDLFGIRRRFDRNNILLPLVTMSGARLTPSQITSLVTHRTETMREVFYRYASSRQETPVVDKHDIERALDAWNWYWIFVEGLFFLIVFMLISAAFGDVRLLVGFWALFMIVWVSTHLQYAKLERLVRPEIQSIAANVDANNANRAVFDAL